MARNEIGRAQQQRGGASVTVSGRGMLGQAVLVWLLVFAACPRVQLHSQGRATFFVSTNGNDSWSGRLPEPNAGRTDGPFASLVRARDAVRELKARASPKEPITVMIRGGRYYLNDAVVLGSEDSGSQDFPITYTAYAGESPILSGGRRVTAWKPYKGQILQAELPATKDGAWKFRQLFLNGERQIRARYPNFDPKDPLYGGWLSTEGPTEKGSTSSFTYKPGSFKHHWAKPTQGEVFSFVPWGPNYIVPISRVDEDRRSIYLTRKQPDLFPAPWFTKRVSSFVPGQRFRVENLLEELDQPGEWCLDSEQGVLYFWPPNGQTKPADEIAVPALDTLIDIQGASWLVISGLTFTETNGGDDLHHMWLDGFGPMFPRQGWKYVGDTLHLEDAEHCIIENNRFYAVGGNAIYLERYNTRNVIRRNEVSYAGANGISLLGNASPVPSISSWLGPKQPMPMFNEVTDNYIHHIGVFNKYVAGIFLGVSDGNLIAHNRIEYMPHHAIDLGINGFGRNIVEYNEIHNVALETFDTGAINGWMNDYQSTERVGHVIRYNLVTDALGCHTDPEGHVVTPDGTAEGIYFDDYSSNSLIYGNIIVRASAAGIILHGGKNNLVENNIIVDSGRTSPARTSTDLVFPSGQMWYSPLIKGEFSTGNRFSRNIAYYSQGKVPVFLYGFSGSEPGDFPGVTLQKPSMMIAQSDDNVLFRADGGELIIKVNSEVDGKLAIRELSLQEWRKLGFDVNSVVADPLFMDPAHDDFRLKPDSPAIRLGFVPIDVAKIGIRH